jgi:hypothetical protein
MRKIIKEAAFAAGLNVTRQTPIEEIRQLIRTLRPVDCGKPLIRIGGDGAGGYLLPDDLEGIEYCFSPGVSTVADFESHLATLHIKSFLADYSEGDTCGDLDPCKAQTLLLHGSPYRTHSAIEGLGIHLGWVTYDGYPAMAISRARLTAIRP